MVKPQSVRRQPPQRRIYYTANRRESATPVLCRFSVSGEQQGVADAGDTLPLLGGGGRHKRPRGAKQQIFQFSPLQHRQKMAAQYAGRAAAAGAAGMDILGLPVKQQQPAIGIILP